MASRLAQFLAELKRRNVFRVAVVYAVVGVGILGAAEVILDPLGLGALRAYLVILVLLGFPIALVLAWAYEVKPEEPARVVSPPEGAPGPGAAPLAPKTGRPSGGAEAAHPGPAGSIVVLPFENLSPDPINAYFADGLTEEIIADLSRIRDVRVISRTSAMTFKDTTRTVPSIARELDVRFALEGSVRRAGDSLRITAQLIDADTDDHLWAEKYAGTLNDVFDLQEQLSRRIVDALKVTLSPDEDRRLAARPIGDARAHDIWLLARQQAFTMSEAGLHRARELVEQALALAGSNALLHATLGWIHAVRFGQLAESGDAELDLAKQHAARALELDPDLPWSRFAQAVVQLREGDLQGFIRWSRRVLEVEQDSHTLAVLSLYLAQAGRVDAARRFAEEAASLDPLSFLTMHAGPHAEVYAGNAGVAFKEMCELADRLAPGEPWPAFEVGYAALQAGEKEEARTRLAVSARSGSLFYSGMGSLLLHVLEDERTEAQRLLTSSVFTTPVGRLAPGCYLIGACYARLGEHEKAYSWLARAVANGFTNHRFMSEHDRLLAGIHGTPGFAAILDKARKLEAALEV